MSVTWGLQCFESRVRARDAKSNPEADFNQAKTMLGEKALRMKLDSMHRILPVLETHHLESLAGRSGFEKDLHVPLAVAGNGGGSGPEGRDDRDCAAGFGHPVELWSVSDCMSGENARE